MGDETCVLIFRILEQMNEDDLAKLTLFGQQHDIYIYLQEGGARIQFVRYQEEVADLTYALPELMLSFIFCLQTSPK